MVFVRRGQRVAIARGDGPAIPAVVINVPLRSAFDGRVLVELQDGYSAYGTSTVVVNKSTLHRRD